MAWIEPRSGKYLVRWREADGTVKSASRRTKQEARTLKAEVESQLLTGHYVAQSTRDQLFGDYVVEALESDLNLEASTLYQHKRIFERWVNPYLGDTPIGDIDAGVLRRYVAQMKKDGASDSTIGRVRATLTKHFRRAHQEGILPRNPLASVPAPKTERRQIRVLTPEEVQGIADAHEGKYRLIPLLSAWGTFRIGEVVALSVTDVEWDRIHVRHAVGVAAGMPYLKGPKSAAGRRVVQLPIWVMNEVREHVLRHGLHYSDWLFPAPNGGLLSHASYHPVWRRALKDAGFAQPWPRPHDLRHTAVALMIKAGAHPKQIQARCGHATIRETMDTYGALFPGHDDELVKILESMRPARPVVREMRA